MLEQLKELLEMQRVLDEAILKEHGNVYDENIAEQMKIALFVELGELMNEFPTKFKHWKKTAKDDREKGLVEYVDALHFALSLTNHSKAKGMYDDTYESYDDLVHLDYSWILYSIMDECCSETTNLDMILSYLFILGNKLGFTWDEIYKAYKKKNAVNYERLKSGY